MCVIQKLVLLATHLLNRNFDIHPTIDMYNENSVSLDIAYFLPQTSEAKIWPRNTMKHVGTTDEENPSPSLTMPVKEMIVSKNRDTTHNGFILSLDDKGICCQLTV